MLNDLFIRAAHGERTERTPVWLMRQAGRFDPEYRRIRERCGLTLEEMFRSPEIVTEISLLPRRFGVDTIIIFQDILTPLAPMGAEFVFRPGPVLANRIHRAEDLRRLAPFDCAAELANVTESIGFIKSELNDELPLLGFAGAPLTLAFFVIEGRSPMQDCRRARGMMIENPTLMHELLERLTSMTLDYLNMQIAAGVDAVQLFESTADLVDDDQYEEFGHRYHQRIFEHLKAAVPTILFAKDQTRVGSLAQSGADVVSIGTGVDLHEARRAHGDRFALQGNVDHNLVCHGTPEQVRSATEKCIRAGNHHGHILNLDHGVLKDTPVENVRTLIDTCHAFRIDTTESSVAGR